MQNQIELLLKQRLAQPHEDEIPPEDRSEMILCHFNRQELEHLDAAQGGIFYDEETGFREYSRLEPLIDSPKVRDYLKDIGEEYANERQVNPEIAYNDKMLDPHPRGWHTTPADHDPTVEHLEEEGTEGDTELALLPHKVAQFFDELRGGIKINPNTGLRMYGPALAIPAMIGGAMGATGAAATVLGAGMLGAGVGAARAAFRGENVLDGALRFGLPAAGAAFGLPFGAAAAGLGAAGASAIGNLATGNQDRLMKDAMMSGALGYGAGALHGGAGSIFGETAATSGAAGGAGATPALAGTAGGALPAAAAKEGLFSSLTSSSMLPWAAVGGLHYASQSANKKAMTQYQKQREEQLKRDRKFEGIDKPYDYTSGRDHYSNYGLKSGGSAISLHHNVKPDVVYEAPRSESWYCEGHEKGQDDNYYVQLNEGDYVISADVVSALGDGNSEAGRHILENYNDQIIDNYPGEMPPTKTKHIDSAISAGEYVFNTAVVTMLGNGDNRKGARKLDAFMRNVRKQKMNNGTKLSPKAMPVLKYLGGRV